MADRLDATELFRSYQSAPTLLLLRQRSLPFIITCLRRSFGKLSAEEVSEETLRGNIAEVQAALAQLGLGEEYQRDPQDYIHEWSRVARAHEVDRPWLTSRHDRIGGRTTYSLQPAANRVLNFFEDQDLRTDTLGTTALSRLLNAALDGASKLSGDTSRRIEILKRRRAELDTEIDELEREGLRPLDDHTRQEIAEEVASLQQQVIQAVRVVPGQIRRHNDENREIYLSDTRPKTDILATVLDRNRDKRRSPGFMLATAVTALQADADQLAEYINAMEVITVKCGELLGEHQGDAVLDFLPSVMKVIHDILAEDTKVVQAQLNFIRGNIYATVREEAETLKDAQSAITRIRNELDPTPRDRRLRNVGIRLTERLNFPLMADIRLAESLPEDPPPLITAPIADIDADPAELLRLEGERVRKSSHLSQANLNVTIMLAMGDKDSIHLSEVLRFAPPIYGAEEVAKYLSLAAGALPSRYVIDAEGLPVMGSFASDPDQSQYVFPDVLFLRHGESAQEIGAFHTALIAAHNAEAAGSKLE